MSSKLIKILDGRVKDRGSRIILEKLKVTLDLTNGKVKKYYLVYFIGILLQIKIFSHVQKLIITINKHHDIIMTYS